MNANVYYLTWDEDREERNWEKLEIKEGQTDPETFMYYRPVVTLEDVDGLEDVWARLNRGPDGYDRQLDELEERSMCKGDLVVTDAGEAHIVRSIGFEEVDLDTDEAPEMEAR